MSLSSLLTKERLDEVPIGTHIFVTWSGGNGPHEYILGRTDGINYAELPLDHPKRDLFLTYNQLTFVGLESYHTHVQIIYGDD